MAKETLAIKRKLRCAVYTRKSSEEGLEQEFNSLDAQREACEAWGSDWPHPGLPDNNKPNDALLFDLLTEWVPDEATRNRILVQNPETLYGFGKPA
jgi:hypothetical protein